MEQREIFAGASQEDLRVQTNPGMRRRILGEQAAILAATLALVGSGSAAAHTASGETEPRVVPGEGGLAAETFVTAQSAGISPAQAEKNCEDTTFNGVEPSLRVRYLRTKRNGRNVIGRVMRFRIDDLDPSDGVSDGNRESCEPYERKPRDFLVWRTRGQKGDKRGERISPVTRVTLEDGSNRGTNVFYSKAFSSRAKKPLSRGTWEDVKIRERRYPQGERMQHCTITHPTYPLSRRHQGIPQYRCKK